jgi:hypothetical protein
MTGWPPKNKREAIQQGAHHQFCARWKRDHWCKTGTRSGQRKRKKEIKEKEKRALMKKRVRGAVLPLFCF